MAVHADGTLARCQADRAIKADHFGVEYIVFNDVLE